MPNKRSLRSQPRSQPKDNWQVYIVRCADGTLYTGVTRDIARRIAEHNGTNGHGTSRGARYTQGRRPVVLSYAEDQPNHSFALKREAAIKRLSKADKEMLVLVINSPLKKGD